MKAFFTLVILLLSVLLSGCGLLDSKEKDQEIERLQTLLALQQGTRTAELEFYERQASIYLGCQIFFNTCSEETVTLGRELLKVGYSGRTSAWYWISLLFDYLACAAAIAFGIFIFWSLKLIFIHPKKEQVLRAQKIVDEIDDYVLKGEQRKAVQAKELRIQELELEKILAEKSKSMNALVDIDRSLWDGYAELETLQNLLTKDKRTKVHNLDEL